MFVRMILRTLSSCSNGFPSRGLGMHGRPVVECACSSMRNRASARNRGLDLLITSCSFLVLELGNQNRLVRSYSLITSCLAKRRFRNKL